VNKLFGKIEDFLNLILEKSFQLFILLLHKVLPPKFFETKNKIQQNIQDKKEFSILWIKSLKPKLLELKEKLIVWLKGKLEYLKSLPWKKMLIDDPINYLNSMKGDDGFSKKFAKILFHLFTKLNHFVQNLTPTQILGFVFIISTAFLGTVNVYVNSQSIINKNGAARTPASAPEEEVIKRPDYYKKGKKSVSLQTVVLPLLVENKKAVRTLTVDFDMYATTRFAAKYLDKNESKVRDYLLMTMEPIDSNFPLNSEEGKEIIKQKIIHEINIFLKEQRVEGEIFEVRLIYVLGV
jgi:flagellar basal body-associated protein FliL